MTIISLWLESNPRWGVNAIDSRTGFSKKLFQILSARGWAFSYDRRGTGRCIIGVERM